MKNKRKKLSFINKYCIGLYLIGGFFGIVGLIFIACSINNPSCNSAIGIAGLIAMLFAVINADYISISEELGEIKKKISKGN